MRGDVKVSETLGVEGDVQFESELDVSGTTRTSGFQMTGGGCQPNYGVTLKTMGNPYLS